jgi:subtilisin-like proprotein convertase family protein
MKKIILLIPLLLLVTASNIFGQSYSPTTSQDYAELHTSRTINQNTRNSFVPIATDPAYSLQLIVSTASVLPFFESAGLTADYENGILYFAGDNTESGIASWDISNQILTDENIFWHSNVPGFYPFVDTDLRFYDGFLWCQLNEDHMVKYDPIAQTNESISTIPSDIEAGLTMLDGSFYISGGFEGGVYKYDPVTGASTTILDQSYQTSSLASLSQGDDSIYSYDTQNESIIKINVNTGLTEVVVGLANYPPSGSTNFVLSYDGNTIYYHTGEEILKFGINSGTLGTLVTGLTQTFGDLTFAPASDGNGTSLYINNLGGDFIEIYEIIGDFASPAGSTPPVGPTLDYTFCSEEMPLTFSPPVVASAGVTVSDSGYPNDTGIMGTELGEYIIESIVLNVQGDTAENYQFSLQSPGGTLLELGGDAGGTDGMDTAVDLVFTDFSTNNYGSWTGGAPAADYLPAGGQFYTTLAGEDINGEWFLLVEGDGADATVNSFCINWSMYSGDAPEIFCLADFTADNDEGACGAVVNFAPPIALDTEDGTLAAANIVQTAGPATGSEFPVGDTDVTFTATDSHGNQTSCTFVVTINDAEAPVAVCQAVTVTLDAMGMGSLVASDLDGGSTDNCGVDSFVASQTTFGCSDVGDVTVVLEVYDVAGNMTSCEATVTVVDETAPVIECVGSQLSSVGGTSGAGEAISSTLPDVVSVLTVTDDQEILDLNLDLNINHTWTGDLTITLESPAGTVVTVFGDGCSADDLMTMLDDESANSLADCNPNGDGNAYPLADYMPTDPLSAFDGEMSMGDWTLTVNDAFGGDDGNLNSWGITAAIEPIAAPPYEVDLNADGTVTILMSDLILSVDEACSYTVTSGGDGAGACDFDNPNDGTFENGYNCSSATAFQTANDLDVAAGGDFTLNQITASIFANGGIASVDVIYYDNNAGLPGTEIGSELGLTPSSQAVIGNNFGIDVNEIVLDLTPVVFTEGKYWVELSVTDTGGTGTVFWVITTSTSMGEPVANFNNGWAYPDSTMDGVVTFSGECSGGGSGGGATEIVLDCSNLGENVIDVVVTDASGNSSSCQSTVVVSDVTAPVLVCGPSEDVTTVTVDFNGSSVPEGWSVSNTAGDFDWTFGASGAINAGGTIPFASNAAIFDDDAAGNGNVNNASLLTPVWDMSGTSSVTMSYDYSFNELGAGETLAVDVYDGAAWQNVVLYDVSVLTPENSGVIDGSALANADFQVRFTYDDAGSWGWNAGVDNFQIDFALPPANQDVVTIALGEDGTAELEAMDFLSEAYDACGIDVLIADLEMVSCDDIGTPIEVTVFATDASGNIASCSVEVVVVDTMAPVLTCPEDVSVMVDPDGTHTVADYIGSGEATATDNCTDPITDFTQDPAPGTVLGVGEWVVTFTATDEYGNVSTCDMNLDLTLLGNEDNELSSAIALYPNPAGEQVTLSNSSNIALETAMIYDLNGKLVSQINLQDMQSERVIDVSSYATGVYMVQITGEQSSVVKRMIKE